MSVIPVLAGGGTIFLDAPGPQDDLRRLPAGEGPRRDRPALPLRGRRRPGRLLRAERAPAAAGLHRRRQQHDRQRADARRLRARGARARRAPLRRRRPRLRRDRRAPRRTRRAPTACAATAIVRHFGETYDNLVLVGGFSKSYSSLLAFIACPTRAQAACSRPRRRPTSTRAPRRSPRWPPCWPASTSTSARGDAIRADLRPKTARVLDALDAPRRRTRRTARACRSSRSRSPTTRTSTRSAASSSSTASTSRSRPTRSSRATRSASASRSPPPTRDAEIDHLIDVLGRARRALRAAAGGASQASAARMRAPCGRWRAARLGAGLPRGGGALLAALPVRPAVQGQRRR